MVWFNKISLCVLRKKTHFLLTMQFYIKYRSIETERKIVNRMMNKNSEIWFNLNWMKHCEQKLGNIVQFEVNERLWTETRKYRLVWTERKIVNRMMKYRSIWTERKIVNRKTRHSDSSHHVFVTWGAILFTIYFTPTWLRTGLPALSHLKKGLGDHF